MKNQNENMQPKNKEISILEKFEIKSLDDIANIEEKLYRIDINTTDSDGRTLLMEAAIWCKQDLLRFLIERGANVNVRDKRNWTALHFAAQAYDYLSVKILVENGADVNAQDAYGNSVISTAVFNSRGKGDIIQFLVNHGADINLKNASQISAKDLALQISNFDVLPYLKSDGSAD